MALLSENEFALEGVYVGGSSARADVEVGALPAARWLLEHRDNSWVIAADPCVELEAVATERVEAGARELLEAGLFAVRSIFVFEQDFAFSQTKLGTVDADLIWVEAGTVQFGQLSYYGAQGSGVVVTKAADGFLCAVESAVASTRYGRGQSEAEVASASDPGDGQE